MQTRTKKKSHLKINLKQFLGTGLLMSKKRKRSTSDFSFFLRDAINWRVLQEN
jgi:hypothetical protein